MANGAVRSMRGAWRAAFREMTLTCPSGPHTCDIDVHRSGAPFQINFGLTLVSPRCWQRRLTSAFPNLWFMAYLLHIFFHSDSRIVLDSPELTSESRESYSKHRNGELLLAEMRTVLTSFHGLLAQILWLVGDKGHTCTRYARFYSLTLEPAQFRQKCQEFSEFYVSLTYFLVSPQPFLTSFAFIFGSWRMNWPVRVAISTNSWFSPKIPIKHDIWSDQQTVSVTPTASCFKQATAMKLLGVSGTTTQNYSVYFAAPLSVVVYRSGKNPPTSGGVTWSHVTQNPALSHCLAPFSSNANAPTSTFIFQSHLHLSHFIVFPFSFRPRPTYRTFFDKECEKTHRMWTVHNNSGPCTYNCALLASSLSTQLLINMNNCNSSIPVNSSSWDPVPVHLQMQIISQMSPFKGTCTICTAQYGRFASVSM